MFSYKSFDYFIITIKSPTLICSCCFMFQDFAIEVIKSTHNFWKALISQKASAGELNW